MLLRDLKDCTVKVTIIPSFPDRLLVETKYGFLTIMSIENFVGMMVDAITKEAKSNV